MVCERDQGRGCGVCAGDGEDHCFVDEARGRFFCCGDRAVEDLVEDGLARGGGFALADVLDSGG